VTSAIREYVRDLGLGAFAVGGSVRDELLGLEHRDEDFLVPDLDQEGLRRALAPHGRIEDVVVNAAVKGVRLHPRERALRELAPAGIELAPGAGSIADDLGRRDFTVNAIARSLDSGALVDPLGGLDDLARREVRMVSRGAFRDDPLRLLRALRLVSQLGFDIGGETLVEMRLAAGGIRDVAPERIGGGLAADGLGELSLLLLGARPERALRLARETGVLEAVLPEFSVVIGVSLDSPRQPLPLDEHVFEVVQATADADAPLRVRLAALLHDLGKPQADLSRAPHADVGRALATEILERLRYPTRLIRSVTGLVGAHSYRLDGPVDARRARRFLAANGEQQAFDLVLLKEADLRAKTVPVDEHAALARLRELLEEARAVPHRLADLAVDGNDLIQLGLPEGPEIGRALHRLLADVVEEPALNDRETLLARAREALP
jgi:tRNA nucleotidyltransferase/poly(A) polymerase